LTENVLDGGHFWVTYQGTILDGGSYQQVYRQHPAQHQRNKRMTDRPYPPNPFTTEETTHNDGGAFSNGGYCVTALTLTTFHKISENTIWDMYMNEVKEEDKRMTDAWKEDANGILVFVSLNYWSLCSSQ